MIVKNNYDETLTNIAASVQKYFGVEYRHKTLPLIDECLEKNKPKNVVMILLDGLGTNILERSLPETAFLRRNLKASLTTVFPATTTAATTSIRTGLNPVEHGYIGWTAYIEPIDKVMVLFLNTEKGNDEVVCEEFLKIKEEKLGFKTITEQINEAKTGKAVELFPFFESPYGDFDEMLERIEKETEGEEKKFIYAYCVEPDDTMHGKGPDAPEVRKIIAEQNGKIEKLAEKLEDTLLIVLADHGHIKTRTVYLEDYPEILELLTRKTAIDQRAVAFKVKEDKKKEFRELFEKNFGEDYELYDSEDVVQAKLFGDGEENSLFRSALGDFLAIATGDLAITAPGDHFHVSHHAGYTDDEIFIPVVIKYCKEKEM